MPLKQRGTATIWVGPATCGKTAAALAEYGAALREGGRRKAGGRLADGGSEVRLRGKTNAPRAMWIAPSRRVAADIRESLASAHAGLLGPGTISFDELAAEVVREAGLLVTPINAQQRRRLLRRLIDEAAAEKLLKHYAPLAATEGLTGLVDGAVAHLQRQGQAPADIRARGVRDDDAQAIDLALLYERYNDRLAGGQLVDAEAIVEVAAQSLATGALPTLTWGLVVLDEFASFSALELRLLAEVSRRCDRMIVTLSGDEAGREDLFAQSTRTIEALRAVTQVDIVTMKATVSAGGPRQASLLFQEESTGGAGGLYSSSPAIVHLERNLFRGPNEVVAPNAATRDDLDRIQIVAASGVQAELVEVAARVKRLLVAGVAPGDVVVAFRSTRDVADRVRQTFEDFGIPAFIDAAPRLAASALVRTLVAVLRLAAEDWPYRRLLEVVGNRSLTLFASPEEDGEARRAMETCVRYAQLPEGRKPLLGQIIAWADDANRTSRPLAEEATLAAVALGRLARLLDFLPRRGPLERWIAALGSLANDLGLLHPATLETAANWSILARALRAAGQVDAATGQGGAEFTLIEFIEAVESAAAQTSASRSNDAIGRVRVLSAEAARHTRPRHLFVAGMSEQAFPATHRAPVAAADGAGELALSRSAEMLLFYQLVTRPTESLTLSYSALDERAQALPPSPFVVEVERAFAPAKLPKLEQLLNYAKRVIEDGETPLSRSELRRGAVGRALSRDRDLLVSLASERSNPTKANGSADGLHETGRAILAGIEAIADRSLRDSFGGYEGVIQSPAAVAALRSTYGQGHLWSPSRLERYAECPFLFFGEQLLKLEPMPELVLASDVRRRGSLLHETLATLYAELKDASLDPAALAGEIAARFGVTLDTVAATRPGRGVDAAIREIERRQIAAWAESFAHQDAAYRGAWEHLDVPPTATYFEARFGPANRRSESRGDVTLSTDEPFRLVAPIEGRDEAVQFAGQVDRIDIGRVGERAVFNIVDYKTGAGAAVRDAEMHAGRQIQLPLYTLAVEQQLLAAEEAQALSAGFWSVRGKGYIGGSRSGGPLAIRDVRDGKLVDAPAWPSTRDRLVARIGEMIAHIRRGQFPVYNENEHCTQQCDLRTVCRIGHVRSLEKMWTGPSDESPERPHAKAQRRKEGEEAELNHE
jgi:ATP-dependent helicase/nuclease subunit B